MADIGNFEHVQKEAALLGFGYYRVAEDGTFLDCNQETRRIFELPAEKEDLSQYSIRSFYVVPSDREVRLKKMAKGGNPDRDVLSVRINGKYKNLFDICWCCPESDHGQKCYVGMITEISSCTLAPQIFEGFPMGLYEVDETDKIVHANFKLVEMLGYQKEEQLLGKYLKELWENPKELDKFNREIRAKFSVNRVLNLRDANHSTIKVEIFSQPLGETERFGMVTNVTKRERYYQAMEHMPTGYFHIEKEKITHCNDHFARVLGYGTKKNAVGNDERYSYVERNAFDQYIEALREADRRGEPLQNYAVQVKKANSNAIITISVDSQLVKDEHGNEIGREGTIRDITEEAALKEKVVLSENNLKKTTEDINKLTHTFLHPVIKFAGNSELQYQMANVLHKTMQPGIPSSLNKQLTPRQLGEKLLYRLHAIRNDIPDWDEPIPCLSAEGDISANSEAWISMTELKSRLKRIGFMFDHRLRNTDSYVLLDDAIRDTTLLLLEELNKWDFSKNELLRVIFNKEFMEFLQNIVFNSLMRGARLLVKETEIMKQKVESLRSYFGLKKERKFIFVQRDISAILEKNIQQFEPIFQQKELKIDYKKSGNLLALVSPNDIDRIICNLLHNAYNYSYGGFGRTVKVKAWEIGHINHAAIYIETFGIPIKKDEIESGKIWEFGYRGEKAYESDRDGTGVGLADCKDVVEGHGGTVEITSVPAKGKDELLEYKVPYLTRVTITIPKFAKKQEAGVTHESH